jgi:BASS family bile acid:Na+ symporter
MKPWIMMRKGIRFNKYLEDRMILVVGSGILLGAVFHRYFIHIKPLVPYLFAYITFAVTLGCSSRQFKAALKSPGYLLLILGMLHIVLPLLATGISYLFLPNQPLLQGGIILVTASPIGIASTMWTSIAGGDVALALTVLIIDTVISPLVNPGIMAITVGKQIPFDVGQLMLGLALMIVLPTFLGMLLHDCTKGTIGKKYKFITGPSTKILLSLVIATNLAAVWDSVHLLKTSLATVIGLALLMGCSGYLLGFICGKVLNTGSALHNTFIFSIGVRNITTGLVLALNYFPELTAVPVVFSIIFQQPLAAVSLRFLARKKNNNRSASPGNQSLNNK